MPQLNMFSDDLPKVTQAKQSLVIGNTKLIEHGIFQEQSYWRIHVSYTKVFIFSTEKMKERCLSKQYRVKPAWQDKIETARGFLVPLKDVSDLQTVEIPDLIKKNYKWAPSQNVSLGQQGKIAEAIVHAMLQEGLIQLPIKVTVETRQASQFAGVDLVYTTESKGLEVKSDLRAEETGNLYIQTHECNPYKQH